MHYTRWRSNGDPLVRTTRRPLTGEERFWGKVDKSGDCWLWKGAKDPGGYGRARWRGRTRFAHRIAYELLVGPIPDGLVIDHLCRTPACVNAAHMEPVTLAENTRRGLAAESRRNKAVCGRGLHPLAGVTARVERRRYVR